MKEIDIIEDTVVADFKTTINNKLSEGWSIVFGTFKVDEIGGSLTYRIMIEKIPE